VIQVTLVFGGVRVDQSWTVGIAIVYGLLVLYMGWTTSGVWSWQRASPPDAEDTTSELDEDRQLASPMVHDYYAHVFAAVATGVARSAAQGPRDVVAGGRFVNFRLSLAA
jgi:hypothetical protein